MAHSITRLDSRAAHRGMAIGTIVLSLIIVALVATGVLVLTNDRGSEDEGSSTETFGARMGDFDITIPASGELAALEQTEIVNKLETQATITEIVAEGATVAKGDVLLRFNDEDVKKRTDDARDAVNTARNALVTSQSNLEIKKHSNASELAKADLAIKLAELALKAWEDGEVVSKRRSLELERDTAKKDHERLAARFEASKDLLAQEFISMDEFQQDEIRMIQASSRLEQAKLAITVYEDYTYNQDRAKFESDLEQAVDERERIGQRHVNDITRLASDVDSKQYQLDSKVERLEKYEGQLEHCVVRAPQDGLVVYAASMQNRRRGGEDAPQVGTELRRNQLVMMLPDTTNMVAEVKVNEALSGKIAKGQTATIVSDAVPDKTLTGEVLSVGVLAESGGWRDPNRRDYTVRISLTDGNKVGLKPSMRCKATIFVEHVEDVLHIPVHAVFRKGRSAFVYVPEGNGYIQRQVRAGRSSELYIEVVSGLEVGDQVLLHEPAAELIKSETTLASNETREGQPGGARPARPQGETPAGGQKRGEGGGRPRGGRG